MEKLATEKQINYIKFLDPNYTIKEGLNIREASIIIHKLKNQKTTTTKATFKPVKADIPNIKDYNRQTELKEAWIKLYGRDEDYWRKKISYILELTDGRLCMFEKSYLKTDFCFGHGFCGVSTPEEEKDANDMASSAKTEPNYFIEENMEEINNQILGVEQYICRLTNGGWYEKFYLNNKLNWFYKNCEVTFHSWYGVDAKAVELDFKDLRHSNEDGSDFEFKNLEDLNNILEVLKNEKKKQEKRLQTYLKRYGLTKLHTWSYLVD